MTLKAMKLTKSDTDLDERTIEFNATLIRKWRRRYPSRKIIPELKTIVYIRHGADYWAGLYHVNLKQTKRLVGVACDRYNPDFDFMPYQKIPMEIRRVLNVHHKYQTKFPPTRPAWNFQTGTGVTNTERLLCYDCGKLPGASHATYTAEFEFDLDGEYAQCVFHQDCFQAGEAVCDPVNRPLHAMVGLMTPRQWSWLRLHYPKVAKRVETHSRRYWGSD